jgi:hypothetical protein
MIRAAAQSGARPVSPQGGKEKRQRKGSFPVIYTSDCMGSDGHRQKTKREPPLVRFIIVIVTVETFSHVQH